MSRCGWGTLNLVKWDITLHLMGARYKFKKTLLHPIIRGLTLLEKDPKKTVSFLGNSFSNFVHQHLSVMLFYKRAGSKILPLFFTFLKSILTSFHLFKTQENG